MTPVDSPRPAAVRETPSPRPPSLVHPGWTRAFPWLVHGTTIRGTEAQPFDLGLFSEGSPRAEVEANWERLRVGTGMASVVHAHQVHGAQVHAHEGAGPGLTLAAPADGHVTDRAGVLLAVTTADCVPVSLVDPDRRIVAMVHAGWRGAAAGVLEAAVTSMVAAYGTDPAALHLHLGPSICGRCYEVGPEVFEALGQDVPTAPRPIDLRAVLAARARRLGLRADRVTTSWHCTRCTGSGLFSHRGGDRARQVGFLGIRPPPGS